jgi:hypothetical protein
MFGKHVNNCYTTDGLGNMYEKIFKIAHIHGYSKKCHLACKYMPTVLEDIGYISDFYLLLSCSNNSDFRVTEHLGSTEET